MEGAELVLVATATPASTAHAVVDSLHRQGIPAGLLRLRVFRPFPADALRHALKNRKKVVVLDRSCSYGHHGAFHQEVKSALYELPAAEHPEVKGVIAGLGGRDITAEDLEEMLLLAWRDKLAESVTWWNTLPEAAALLVSE